MNFWKKKNPPITDKLSSPANGMIPLQARKLAFISHSSKDADAASKIRALLENQGIACWIAPRDVRPGFNYDEEIVDGIENTKVIIILVSRNSNESKHVKRELELAMNQGNAIFPLRIQNVEIGKGLKFYLAGKHWVDAWQPPLEQKIKEVAAAIRAITGESPIDAIPLKSPVKRVEEPSSDERDKAASVEKEIPEDIDSRPNPPRKEPIIPQETETEKASQAPSTTSKVPQEIAIPTDTKPFVFLKNGASFKIGSRDSKITSFRYIAGTPVQYIKKGIDPEMANTPVWATYFQLPSVGDKDVWLTNPDAYYVDTDDKRVFFKISETDKMGYLVDGGVEGIQIAERLLGEMNVKLDQIESILVDQSDITTIQTRESGVLTGSLKKYSNFSPYLVIKDAEIVLFRGGKHASLTLNRIATKSQPPIHPNIYWDRSQLKFRISSSGAVVYFNERDHDSHIPFTEQSLGWMRISIPQIKRLTVNNDNKEVPVVIETFAGNVYRGVCPEQFNMSGAMVSLDKVRGNLVLEAFDREAPRVETPTRSVDNESVEDIDSPSRSLPNKTNIPQKAEKQDASPVPLVSRPVVPKPLIPQVFEKPEPLPSTKPCISDIQIPKPPVPLVIITSGKSSLGSADLKVIDRITGSVAANKPKDTEQLDPSPAKFSTASIKVVESFQSPIVRSVGSRADDQSFVNPQLGVAQIRITKGIANV